MNYWLMKTEPDTFSFDDLCRCLDKTTAWDGVRNYQARNLIRDDFKSGDRVFIYHSRVKEPHIIGIGTVISEAYPDKTALDPNAKYFDEKSAEKGESRWFVVDIQARQVFKNPVTLTQMRAIQELEGMALLKKGQRLSIQPVSDTEWNVICELGDPIDC